MSRPGPCLLVVCGVALSAASGAQPAGQPERRQAPPQPPPVRVLIDRSLQETAVRLLGLDPGSVTFTPLAEPAEAPARTRALSELLAIAPQAGAVVPARPVSREAAPLVAVATADGQRLVGHVRTPVQGETKGQDAEPPVVCEHPVLGRVALPLDLVAGLELIETLSPAPIAGGTDDVVILANGDRIDGFVESIGTVVVISPKGGSARVEVPLDRVRRVGLANRATPASGTLLWLSDGSVVALEGPFESDGQVFRATLQLAGTSFVTPLNSITALALDARQIRPLGALAPAEFRASSERRWTRPPRALEAPTTPLGAPDIEIPGPMSIDWVLPQGAARLAGTAELARSTQGWGDCEVVIEDMAQGAPPRRLFSRRLTGNAPEARFDVALAPAQSAEHRLRITVEAGQHGPIQDRVYLRRALLLVAEGAAPR